PPTLRIRTSVQLSVSRRHYVIIKAVVEVNRNTCRKFSAKILREIYTVEQPTTLPEEWSGDEKNAAELWGWHWLCKQPHKNRPAYGVPDKNGAILESNKLLLKHGLPKLITWIALVRHTWIANVESVSERVFKAGDKFVVPFVMDTFTTTLNEEELDLLAHVHSSNPNGGRLTPTFRCV